MSVCHHKSPTCCVISLTIQTCIYHLRMRVGNIFSHVCLCVCLSICVSVCSAYNFWTPSHKNFIFRPFVKDLEAHRKVDEWIPISTHPQTSLLVHNIYLICKTFVNNLIVYLHQLISIVKFEIVNGFKIMPSKVRLKKLFLGIWTCLCGWVVSKIPLAHTHFNMFVDEWMSANDSPDFCYAGTIYVVNKAHASIDTQPFCSWFMELFYHCNSDIVQTFSN